MTNISGAWDVTTGTQLYDIPDHMLEIYNNDERSTLVGYTTAQNYSTNLYFEYGQTYYIQIETNISDLCGFNIIIEGE